MLSGSGGTTAIGGGRARPRPSMRRSRQSLLVMAVFLCLALVALAACISAFSGGQVHDTDSADVRIGDDSVSERGEDRPNLLAGKEHSLQGVGGSHVTSGISSKQLDSRNSNLPRQHLSASRSRRELLLVFVGDSITFGNGSHTTPRWRERRGNGEGSYPLEFLHHFQHSYKSGEGSSSSSSQSSTSSDSFDATVAYNYGVSGRTATNGIKSKSYSLTKEFAMARSLLRDASMMMRSSPSSFSSSSSPVAAGGNGGAAKQAQHHNRFTTPFWALSTRTCKVQRMGKNADHGSDNSNDEAANTSPHHHSMQSSRQRDKIHRTILVVIKLGTNDSKDAVWMGRGAFEGNYTQLINELLPMDLWRGQRGAVADENDDDHGGVVSDGSTPTTTTIGDDTLAVRIVFMTPIPSFPRPSAKDEGRWKPIIGGIRGQRIGNDIRKSVFATADTLAATILYEEVASTLILSEEVAPTMGRSSPQQVSAIAGPRPRAIRLEQVKGSGGGGSGNMITNTGVMVAQRHHNEVSVSAAVYTYDLYRDMMGFIGRVNSLVKQRPEVVGKGAILPEERTAIFANEEPVMIKILSPAAGVEHAIVVPSFATGLGNVGSPGNALGMLTTSVDDGSSMLDGSSLPSPSLAATVVPKHPLFSHNEEDYISFTKRHLASTAVFRCIHDGVHPSALGHEAMARLLLWQLRRGGLPEVGSGTSVVPLGGH